MPTIAADGFSGKDAAHIDWVLKEWAKMRNGIPDARIAVVEGPGR